MDLPNDVHLQFDRFYSFPGSNLASPPDLVEFTLQRGNWQDHFQIPLSSLTAKKLESLCSYLRFPSQKERVCFDQDLVRAVAEQASADQRGYYLSKQGAVYLPNGQLCFLRGQTLVGCNRSYALTHEMQELRLLSSGNPPMALAGLLLDAPLPVYLVIAYVILTSIRSVLMDNGIDVQAVLYIHGGSGLGKTYLASHLAGFVTSVDSLMPLNILQAGSSLSSTKTLLATLRDLPVVVDDLCLSASKHTERKRKELGADLVRFGTSHSPTTKQYGGRPDQQFCAAGLILTAEFTLENQSDLNRCLIVPVKQRLNISPRFSPELMGDTILHFSKWFTEHVEQELNRFAKARAEISDDSRMNTNYGCLEAAFLSLTQYMEDQALASPAELHLIKSNIQQALRDALYTHFNLRSQLLESIPVGNLSYCILTGFTNGAFSLAKKVPKLASKDGIIKGHDLCLRPEALIQFVRAQPGYHEWTQNRIRRTLKDLNALVLQDDTSSTVHLDSHNSNRAPRVYRIRLDVLEDTAECYQSVPNN